MNCHEIQQFIPFLDDGTLDEDKEQQIHAHIATCSLCRSAYDAEVHLRSLVHTAYPPAGEGLPRIDVRDAVRAGIEKRKKQHSTRRYVYSAAAAVLIAITAFTGFMMNRSMIGQPMDVADTEDFYEYVADLYVTSYDLMVNASDDITFEDEVIEPGDVFGSAYVSVSMEDMINNIDPEELGNMLAMSGF